MRRYIILFFFLLPMTVCSLLDNKEMRNRIAFGFTVGAITNLCGSDFFKANLWGVTVNQLAAYLMYTIPFYEAFAREKRQKLLFVTDRDRQNRMHQDYSMKEKNYLITSYGANFLGYLLGGAFGSKIKPYLVDALQPPDINYQIKHLGRMKHEKSIDSSSCALFGPGPS